MRGLPLLSCVVALALAACGEPQASAQGEAALPTSEGLPGPVAACVDDYRRIGAAGLPAIPEGQAFAAWYAGPFQTWTRAYNDVRARCDEVFAPLEPTSREAQAMLGAQSYLHERAAAAARPLEAEPQMFVLATYWELGAACTYQSCQQGPDAAWTRYCAAHAEGLPPCPPVEPEPAPAP